MNAPEKLAVFIMSPLKPRYCVVVLILIEYTPDDFDSVQSYDQFHYNMAIRKSQERDSSHLYDAFLSYSSSDKQEVELLAARLEDEAGLKLFLDKWCLVPGEPWQENLEEALSNSATCVVFIGPAKLGSWQKMEMRAALAAHVQDNSFRVILVVLPKAKPQDLRTLSPFLDQFMWVNFQTEPDAFSRLVAGIRGFAPGRKTGKTGEPSLLNAGGQERTLLKQSLRAYRSVSPIILGVLILVSLIAVWLASVVPDQLPIIRFLIALSAGFFSIFFVGGILLKGTLKGLYLSAIGGLIFFVLIQFIFDPLRGVHHPDSLQSLTLPPSASSGPLPDSVLPQGSAIKPAPGSSTTPKAPSQSDSNKSDRSAEDISMISAPQDTKIVAEDKAQLPSLSESKEPTEQEIKEAWLQTVKSRGAQQRADDSLEINNYIAGMSIKIVKFEKLGCKPASQGAGYFCTYNITTSSSMHSNEGSESSSRHAQAINKVFLDGNDENRTVTSRVVKSKEGWIMSKD